MVMSMVSPSVGKAYTTSLLGLRVSWSRLTLSLQAVATNVMSVSMIFIAFVIYYFYLCRYTSVSTVFRISAYSLQME